MQINLLKNIVSDIAGRQVTEIVDLLADKKDVNEFLIAKKLKLTINQTRNILYKLSDAGIVSFIRKKDKRKGWYIYFWTLNTLKSLELLESNLNGEIKQLEKQLNNRETKRYYHCKLCNVEVGEETALLEEFICKECGQVFELSDNSNPIKEIESKILRLKKNLDLIKEERMKESDKQGKKRERSTKREEQKKKALRRAKRKKTMAKNKREKSALKNKLNKKIKKKPKKKLKKKKKKA